MFAGGDLFARYWCTALSETGRIRFRGVRFQTPNLVTFSGLTEFRGANSVSSFQPIVCKQELTEFLAELTEFVVELSEFSVLKQYSRNSIPPAPYFGFPKI